MHATGSESLLLARYGQNNPAIALNRKNSLFAGHDEGAVNWACLASLIETAKLHGVDPQAYLADILAKLVNGWPAQKLDELLPVGLALEHQSSPRSLIADPIATRC